MWTSGAALAIGLFVLTPITAAAAAVRTVDSRAEALIAEGAQRSATFRGLIDRLDRTRWIVFVQRGRCRDATWSHGLRASPLGPPGCLIHRVGTYEGHPYLIVRIDTRYSQTPDHEISLLAHELQHAIEAAEAPDVIDTQTLTTFFERISEVSFRSPGLIGYETGAAVRVGRQVLTELRKRPLKPDVPPRLQVVRSSTAHPVTLKAEETMKSVVLPAALAALIVLAPQAARADAVTRWNALAGEAAKAACLIASGNGLAESRMYAMAHVAIHDALNAIKRRSQPYAYDVRVNARTSARAAVAAAAHDVLVSVIARLQESPQCIADGIARADADYATELAAIPDGAAKDRGVEVGRAAAAAIVHLRESDGSNVPLLDFAYEQGNEPGEYRFTPGFNFVFAPDWAKVTPFALKHAAQFRANPPYPIRSKKYAADYNEIRAVGGIGDPITPTERTAEQTLIGLFWIESSPFAWNRLARSLSARKGLDAWENARLFGLLNLAMADGYIGSWESKYHYNFWRPVTAIHEGDADGNPDTAGDPNWTPLVLTYPIPDHDSGHAVQGGVAAEVLKRFFGTDRIRFKACSLSLPAGNTCDDASPVLRRFKSFSQAANENALSRVLIGIHFRRAVDEGVRHGRRIGKWTVAHYLQETK